MNDQFRALHDALVEQHIEERGTLKRSQNEDRVTLRALFDKMEQRKRVVAQIPVSPPPAAQTDRDVEVAAAEGWRR